MPADVDDAKRRYGFDTWAGRNLLDRELHVQDWFVPRERLGLVALARSRPLPVGRRAFSSVWRGAGTALLRLDVSEQGSRGTAHDLVVAVLDNFESPIVTEVTVGEAIGDVAFSAPGTRVIVFARANLVVLLASVGPFPIDVTNIARSLDDWIVAEQPPESVGPVEETATAGAPRLELRRVGRGAIRRVVVDVPAEIATSGPPMLKLYADTGTIYGTKTGVHVRPGDGRAPTVTAYLYERTLGGVGRCLRSRARP